MHPRTGVEVRDVSDTDYSYLLMRRSGSNRTSQMSNLKSNYQGLSAQSSTNEQNIFQNIIVQKLDILGFLRHDQPSV